MRKDKRGSGKSRRPNYARKMNMLHSNFALCQQPSKNTRKKEMAVNKKKAKAAQKTYYESPLKHIQRSSKKKVVIQAQKRVTRSSTQAEKQKSILLSTDVCHNESVIILSDNECETNGQKGSSNSQRPKESNKKTVSAHQSDKSSPASTEPLRTLPYKSSNVKSSKVNASGVKKRKRKAVPVVDPDVSCLILSDAEDSEVPVVVSHANGENIAPVPGSANQATDDIVVVWSSTINTESESQSQIRLDEDSNDEAEVNQRLFMIDYTPNKKNLNCLESSQKKRKVDTGEKNDSWDTHLPFSKPGLKLPDLCETDNLNVNQNSALGNGRAQKAKQHPLNLPRTTLTSVINSTTNSITNTTTIPTTNSITNTTSIAFSNTTSTIPSICSTTNSNTTSCLEQGTSTSLREIIIDGNNVAMAHTNGKSFSERGLKLVIDYFKWRGHTVKAFVPQHRRSLAHPMLEKWYREGIVVFTPSRNIGGRRITPYDDRFILEYATMCGGIVVSMDQYRDLYMEKPAWRDTIENRLLVPTFVGDYIMFPEDPLGRKGPRLDEFLRH